MAVIIVYIFISCDIIFNLSGWDVILKVFIAVKWSANSAYCDK